VAEELTWFHFAGRTQHQEGLALVNILLQP